MGDNSFVNPVLPVPLIYLDRSSAKLPNGLSVYVSVGVANKVELEIKYQHGRGEWHHKKEKEKKRLDESNPTGRKGHLEGGGWGKYGQWSQSSGAEG